MLGRVQGGRESRSLERPTCLQPPRLVASPALRTLAPGAGAGGVLWLGELVQLLFLGSFRPAVGLVPGGASLALPRSTRWQRVKDQVASLRSIKMPEGLG